MAEAVDLKKVRITSDGTTRGTKVFDENGNLLGRITSMHIFADVEDDLLRADLRIILPEIDVEISREKANIEEVEDDAPSS